MNLVQMSRSERLFFTDFVFVMGYALTAAIPDTERYYYVAMCGRYVLYGTLRR